jgi:peptidoglycan/LPS O-acetylase OafA/YrhL
VTDAKRYVFIDALRGFAALAVVLFHVAKSTMVSGIDPYLPTFVTTAALNGVAGVFVFFVLSGFVIAHCTCREEVTASFAARFMVRRSVRLDPPYWASMLLAVLLGALPAIVDASKSYVLPSVWDVFLHVTYLVTLVGGQEIDAVYWTLCLEIQFYLVFLLVMGAVTTLTRVLGREHALNAVLWTCVVVADLWPLGWAPFQVRGLFLEHWYMFLAGVLVWRARDGALRAVVPAVGNLVVLGLVLSHRGDYPALVGILSAAVILLVAMRGRLTTLLRHRHLQLLGAMSYSLYLVHNPVLATVFRFGYWITGRSLAFEVFWLVTALAACLVTAWVFHRLIELPSLRLSRHISMRRLPLAGLERSS